MPLSRKEFIKTTLALAVAGLAPACGDDEDGDSSASSNTGGSPSSSNGSSSSASGSGASGAQGGNGSGATGGEATGAAGGGGNGTGGNGTGGMQMGNCVENGTSVTIASNHGHALVVSKEDVAAGMEKAYDITGMALHSHTVTVTAAHFTQLQANSPVTIVSSMGSMHTHSVTVTCA